MTTLCWVWRESRRGDDGPFMAALARAESTASYSSAMDSVTLLGVRPSEGGLCRPKPTDPGAGRPVRLVCSSIGSFLIAGWVSVGQHDPSAGLLSRDRGDCSKRDCDRLLDAVGVL